MKRIFLFSLVIALMGLWSAASAQMMGTYGQDSTYSGWGMHPGYMGNNWMWHNQQGYNNMGNGYMGNSMQNWMPGMRYISRHRLSSSLDLLEPYMWIVNRLPALQDQLALSQEQTGKIIDMQMNFLKQKIDLDASLIKGQINLKQLVKSGASPDAIADQLTKCNEMSTRIAMGAYQTALNMEGVLNTTQKQQLNDIVTENFPSDIMSGYMMNY